MKDFEYIIPQRLQDVSDLLTSKTENTLLKAGGTDLLGLLKEGIYQPTRVIQLSSLPSLHGIQRHGDRVEIGAATHLSTLIRHPLIQKYYPGLVQALESIATPQIRNMASLGGNLCQRPRCWYFRGKDYHCLKKGGDLCYAAEGMNKYHAIFGGGPCYFVHPSDAAPMLIALQSTVRVQTGRGSHEIPLEKFFILPEKDLTRENILGKGEFISHIIIPIHKKPVPGVYLKFRERETSDFSLVSVAVAGYGKRGKVDHLRLVLGGVAPIPWFVPEATSLTRGKRLSNSLIEKVAHVATQNADPLTYNAYKVPLTYNLVKRALHQWSTTIQ